MGAERLSRHQLAEHLTGEETGTGRTVRALRREILRMVPRASEVIRFGCLCYCWPNAEFGAIGGNICMIELPKERRGSSGVALSFIHGAFLDDPDRLLQGRAKAKRFVPIPDAASARSPKIAALIRASVAAAAERARD